MKPVYSKKIGRVEGAVWLNDSVNGKFYSATYKTSYQDGDEWKDGDRFNIGDSERLLEVVADVVKWMGENSPEG